MKFIPVRLEDGKKRAMGAKWPDRHWNGVFWKKQEGIGIQNGIDGIACLDIDDLELATSQREYLAKRFPCVITRKGGLHIYFNYIGSKYDFCWKRHWFNNKPSGEIRLSRSFQVFPSNDTNLPLSMQYKFFNCDINSFKDLPVLNDDGLDNLMNDLKIEFRYKEVIHKTNILTPLSSLPQSIVAHFQTDFDYKSYLPSGWDQNHGRIWDLVCGINTAGEINNKYNIFALWIRDNRFLKKHSPGYYENKFEKALSIYKPLIRKETVKQIVERLQEGKTFKTKQKMINHVLFEIMKEWKDEYGEVRIGATVFKSVNWGLTEYRRAIDKLTKDEKIKRTFKGYPGTNSLFQIIEP